MKQFLAYEGKTFRIEWYWDENERSQPLDHFNGLNDRQKAKALALFMRMGDFGKILDTTKFRSEGDKIYAFKPKPNRFLSFFWAGKRIIVTNAFVKKSNKLPNNEKNRALRSMKDYKRRMENGTYYKE